MTDDKKNGEITEPVEEKKAEIEGDGKEAGTDKKIEAKEATEKKEEVKEPEIEKKEKSDIKEAAPEAEAAPAPEPVTKEPIVTTATLGGEALFENNSAELNAASQQALGDLATELGKFQEITSIDVIGHTDSSGEADYNQGLSERRAAAVEAYLASVYPNVQMSSSGMGENSPVATNSNREGRQMNRRVEVQVTAKSITE